MLDAVQIARSLTHAEAAALAGRFAEAEAICHEILKMDPENQSAGVIAGACAARQGNIGLAIHLFKQIVRKDSTQWDSLNWLCVLLRQTGETNQAIICGRRACELIPSSAEGQTNLGSCYLAQWKYDQAFECFQKAVALSPTLATAQHNCGVCLQRMGRLNDAEAAYRRAAELEPSAPNSLVSLGRLLLIQDNFASATKCFDDALTRVKDSVEGLQALARAFSDEGLIPQAESTLAKALRLSPKSAEIIAELAHTRQTLGRFSEAITGFETALKLEPNRIEPYFELVQCRRIKSEDQVLIDRMIELLSRPHLTNEQTIQLHYGLGKAYDDLGAYDKAFPHFRTANELVYIQQQGMRLDHDGLAAGINQIIATFTPEFFEANRTIGDDSELPILIVGMIRSGTTLVEQILSSHPSVGAAGELMFLLENGAVLHPTQGLLEARAKAVAENYLRLLTSIAPNKLRVTDKMPNNYFMLGLVHLLFPKARIVHCRRDPADTCVSIYMTPFRNTLNFAHHTSDIVFNYHQYTRLMSHWRAVLPSECFMEVDYESLVGNREPVVRRLLDFAGLEWNEACLQHESRGGAVLTPSNWQVRQPIYRSSVGRWNHYKQWLPEFATLESEES